MDQIGRSIPVILPSLGLLLWGRELISMERGGPVWEASVISAVTAFVPCTNDQFCAMYHSKCHLTVSNTGVLGRSYSML